MIQGLTISSDLQISVRELSEAVAISDTNGTVEGAKESSVASLE